MDTAQRQRIADAICEEWENLEEGDDLKSADLHQRLVGEGMDLDSKDLMYFLDELEEANLISHTKFIGGHRRVTDVSRDLCDYPLNY